MKKAAGLTEISQRKTIEALQKALDQTYRQLLETAKADWQRLFAAQDPADPFVTIRISESEIADELAGMPRAGLVSLPPRLGNGKVRRRLA